MNKQYGKLLATNISSGHVTSVLIEDTDGSQKLFEPVKHGHWDSFTHDALMGFDEFDEPIWKPKIVYHCHNCRRKTVIKEKYCPNCGAKMDGEVSELWK